MDCWYRPSCVVALSLSLLFPSALPLAADSPSAGSEIQNVRRLSESQYRNIIAHTFGDDIEIKGRFELSEREAGLLELGNSYLTITPSGMVQYDAIARYVAEQALDDSHRDELVPCKPSDPAKADSGCASQFVDHYGEILFRRPLQDDELSARVAVANEGAAKTGDFYHGLQLALVSLLDAPQFLFRVERAEPHPDNPGELRLDAYTKASRLSFLLWDAGPDAQLLTAAANGSLHTEEGLNRELTRMLDSPRLEAGVRAFFADMLQLSKLDDVIKDVETYPKFSQSLLDSAREETLRTVVHLLLTQDGDYRDLLTTRTTFLNRTLAAVYDVPFLSGGQPWMSYTFPEEAERAGVLTQASFLSSFAHAAASSPTLRGVGMNEIFACSPTPAPPADVDFSNLQSATTGTSRERLTAHRENAGCISCHLASDPLGLSLEHFDGIGQKRLLENGVLIDVSAEVSGKKFNGAAGLGEFLQEDSRVPSCVVKQVYAYGTGQQPSFQQERNILKPLTEQFAESGYRIKPLLRAIASSPSFLAAEASQTVAAANPRDK